MVRPAGADGEWRRLDTAQRRRPVESLEAEAPVLAAADLAATLPEDAPVGVRRFWEVDNGVLALRFEVTNRSDAPLEIGAFGMPLVFNNILDGHSLDDAHAICSFHDPYIVSGAGYLQVIRLNGQGPVLLVVPQGDTRFEAYPAAARTHRQRYHLRGLL